MRPSIPKAIVLSCVTLGWWFFALAELITHPAFMSGNVPWRILILFSLVVMPICFFSFGIHPFISWKRDIKNHETNGTFEELAEEFQNASSCFNRGRLRLGSHHLFCKEITDPIAYDDILAIILCHDKEDKKVMLGASIKEKETTIFFPSVKWRSSDMEIQDALSAILEHNPKIECRLRNL